MIVSGSFCNLAVARQINESICSVYPHLPISTEKILEMLKGACSKNDALLVEKAIHALTYFKAHPLSGKETAIELKDLRNLVKYALSGFASNDTRAFIKDLHDHLHRIDALRAKARMPIFTRNFGRVYENALVVQKACKSYRELTKNIKKSKGSVYVNQDVNVIVKGCSDLDCNVEFVTNELMKISLTYHTIPSLEVDNSRIHDFFYNNQNDYVIIKPYVDFIVINDIRRNIRRHLLSVLDFESQCAIFRLLELQPVDHHGNNIGLRISRNEFTSRFHSYTFVVSDKTFTISTLLLTYLNNELKPETEVTRSHKDSTETSKVTLLELFGTRNEAERIQWEIVFFDNERMLKTTNGALKIYIENDTPTSDSQPFHIVAIRFELILQTDIWGPISDALVDELLNKKRDEALLAFISNKRSRNSNKVDKHIPQDMLLDGVQLSDKMLEALKQRLSNRRQFLLNCKEFNKSIPFSKIHELLTQLLNSPGNALSSSEKFLFKKRLDEIGNDLTEETKDKLQVLYLDFRRHFTPTFFHITCAMYPLLRDTIELLGALGLKNHYYVGNYLVPYEALIYKYLSSYDKGQFTPRLKHIHEVIENNNMTESSMSLLCKLHQDMKAAGIHCKLAHEIEHIFKATKPDAAAFYITTSSYKIDWELFG